MTFLHASMSSLIVIHFSEHYSNVWRGDSSPKSDKLTAAADLVFYIVLSNRLA